MKSNQKIFITGSSSGIGEAIAYEYASQGAILGLAARRSEKLETVKAKCMELGCLLYTSPSPRDGLLSRMPSSA